MVTRCGRDIHREINGYFFPQDDTLAVYELKHLAKRLAGTSANGSMPVCCGAQLLLVTLCSVRPSAFAMFDRRQYYRPRGRRRGELYTLADIYEVSAYICTYVMHMYVQMYTLGLCNNGEAYVQYTVTIGIVITSNMIITWIMPYF